MRASHFPNEQFIVILHTSATCDEHQVCVSKDVSEIIQLAWVVVDAETLEEVERNSVLVRPVSTPVTDLCTNSTSLTWEDVENAGSFQEAVAALDATIRELILSQNASFSFVVLNASDLRVQIPREARDKAVTIEPYLQHPRLYDLRLEYTKWQALHPEALLFSPGSLTNMCATLDIDPIEQKKGNTSLPNQFNVSDAHPALDQCLIMHGIVKAMLRRTQQTDRHNHLFTRPIDVKADVSSFLTEKSKVLYLSGLANDTTQSELESWFTQHGGRPIAFWTLRTPDQHKPTGTGFAIFSTHEEASDSLSMNGKALGDRTIEVSASSPRILDRAAEILTPFPPSKNRPRPGDWTCPSCGFSNFQRRTACFRCSYPSGGPLDSMPYYPPAPMHAGGMGALPGYPSTPMHNGPGRSMPGSGGGGGGGGGGGHVPFRAGDWTCQNCTYHNFARNSVCLKCSMARAPQGDMNMMRYDDYHNYSMTGISDELARI